MPHATEDEAMGGIDEAAEIHRFLGGGSLVPGGDSLDDHAFDQTDKADNAIDYEDISEDDLPEEEEATTSARPDGDGDLNGFFDPMPASLATLPAQPPTNGFHEPKDTTGDLFGDTDEANDLFGDRTSSPEEERHPQDHEALHPQQQQQQSQSQSQQQQQEQQQQQHEQQILRPSGLALPTKAAGLALPAFSGSYSSPRPQIAQAPQQQQQPNQTAHGSLPLSDREFAVMSPNSMTSDDDDEDLDPELALQRRLFKDSKRRNAGEDVLSGPVDTDMNLFHTLYPRYEQDHAPDFIQLFPPRPVEFKGKVPLKPPKPLQPAKLGLDLLHDQERAFKAIAAPNKAGYDSTFNNSLVKLASTTAVHEESDDDLALSTIDENEILGNVTMRDLALICEDWDLPSLDTASIVSDLSDAHLDAGWDAAERERPAKKRRTDSFTQSVIGLRSQDTYLSFEDPERATARLAKTVALDLNDPNLMIDEHSPRTKRKVKRVPGDVKRDTALSRDLAKRYNISNDQAYDLLKENHQHKVRSTLGSMAVEHSYPATKLQFPFYTVALDNKVKRTFHRPQLELKNGPGREYRFQKPRHIKKKNWRGKEAKDVYAKAEDLSLGDNASTLLLEYSEEAPLMLSNFGMGNRLINYYRKKDADDQERPKRDIGETHVLLTQDKSPFANFGHVDKGEIVPTIQNGLYRAPVFQHDTKPTDFLIGVSSTYEYGDRLFLRNVEHLHTVGQQFPLAEVPGQHSRKVTDAAKKRLRALSYRIYTKSLTRRDKVLDNHTLMPHLPGHDMPQTRSKMREFMDYDRMTNKGESGVWVPKPGQAIPDTDTLRSWIKPEDICLLDSMQVGVQHLADLGISETKDGDDDKDIDEGSSIEQQLAPWRATKNFLNACQGKAMLKLHGDGDPTGRGEGFSFVKTSMKGGFRAAGESVADKLDARRRKENGGHSYNVAKQQKAYDESIRRIWDAQKASLTNGMELSDTEMEDEAAEPESAYPYGRAATPRSAFGTPAAFSRHEDESVSQFSGQSFGRDDKTLVITRKGGFDKYGQPRPDEVETITNQRVIREYRKRFMAKQVEKISLLDLKPTGNPELDALKKQQLEKELARVTRNADRRVAREKAKGKSGGAGSPSADASPGPSEAGAPTSAAGGAGNTTEGTPQKGRGRNKDGTARKCANCGQVGHIKTNRKSVSTFVCPLCRSKQRLTAGHTRHDRTSDEERDAELRGAASFAQDSYSAFVL